MAVLVSVVSQTSGQTLSLGVVGGSSLTSDYGGTGTRILRFPAYGLTVTQITHTSLHTFIIGPKLELEFPGRISIEVDALRRPRGRGTDLIFSPPILIGSELVSSDSWRTSEPMWEVPVLAKYRFPLSERAPFRSLFIEGGPSFRPWLYWSEDARVGFTAGAGMRVRLRNVNLEPTIRYTRWAAKRTGYAGYVPSIWYHSHSKLDQIELLVGVGSDSSSLRPSVLGRKLSIGVMGGLGLTGDFPEKEGFSSARSNMVGLALESAVTERLSVEFDALYRPRILSERARATVLNWEFPLLAKYKFPTRRTTPFLELGPSFRTSGNTNGTNPSRFGITAGAGIETTVHKLRVSPALRHTYWGADRPGEMSPASGIRNQVGFVVGFLF